MRELGKVLAAFPLQSSCEPSHILTKAQARFDLSMLEDLQNSLPLSIGVKSNTVYRTKMPLHSAKLFFKSQVEEPGRRKKSGAWFGTRSGFPQKKKTSTIVKHQPRLKFANPGGGRGHIHGLLPTTEHNLQRAEATTLQDCLHHAPSSRQGRREPSPGEASHHASRAQELTDRPREVPASATLGDERTWDKAGVAVRPSRVGFLHDQKWGRARQSSPVARSGRSSNVPVSCSQRAKRQKEERKRELVMFQRPCSPINSCKPQPLAASPRRY